MSNNDYTLEYKIFLRKKELMEDMGYEFKESFAGPMYKDEILHNYSAGESDKVPYGYDSDKLDGGYYDEG